MHNNPMERPWREVELCRLEALWHRAKAPHLTPPSGGWNDEDHRSTQKKTAPDKHGGKGPPPLQVMPCFGEEEED